MPACSLCSVWTYAIHKPPTCAYTQTSWEIVPDFLAVTGDRQETVDSALRSWKHQNNSMYKIRSSGGAFHYVEELSVAFFWILRYLIYVKQVSIPPSKKNA